MQIETYEQAETLTLTDEESAEFKRITDELGLLKQQAFIGAVAVNPFRGIRTDEKRVYSELLTKREEFSRFDNEASPLRVLKIAEMCIKNGWFRLLQVWYDDGVKDPLLVGFAGDSYSEPYILARWGDELENFEILRQRAVQRRVEIQRLEREKALQSVEQDTRLFMHGHGW
jgi:hypothetical protein